MTQTEWYKLRHTKADIKCPICGFLIGSHYHDGYCPQPDGKEPTGAIGSYKNGNPYIPGGDHPPRGRFGEPFVWVQTAPPTQQAEVPVPPSVSQEPPFDFAKYYGLTKHDRE